MEITIVGLPYYGYKKGKVKVGDNLLLSHDKTNAHSATAVVVHHAISKIGYVTGRESEEVLKLIDPYKYYTAIVTEVRASCLKASLAMLPYSDNEYRDDAVNNTDAADALAYSNPCQEVVLTGTTVGIKNPFNEKPKEKSMFDKIVNTNVAMANSAAFLEAGRIANNTAAKFVASKAPLMVKGYVDTAVGKLIIANAAAVAVEKFRPADKKLARLANAMITEAYQEVYRIVDIEKMLNEMLTSESVKAALAKLEVSDASSSVG